GVVTNETLLRFFDYWKSVAAEIGKRSEEAVYADRANDVAPHPTEADPSETVENRSINEG
ncbi:MAG: hypothetical protein ACR2HA_04520, partial [Nocardioides sp.]